MCVQHRVPDDICNSDVAFMIAQLVDGEGAGSLPQVCPVRESWQSPYFETIFGRDGNVPFHVVLTRFELLVVMYTVYAVRGISSTKGLMHQVSSSPSGTIVDVHVDTACPVPVLMFVDQEHTQGILGVLPWYRSGPAAQSSSPRTTHPCLLGEFGHPVYMSLLWVYGTSGPPQT